MLTAGPTVPMPLHCPSCGKLCDAQPCGPNVGDGYLVECECGSRWDVHHAVWSEPQPAPTMPLKEALALADASAESPAAQPPDAPVVGQGRWVPWSPERRAIVAGDLVRVNGLEEIDRRPRMVKMVPPTGNPHFFETLSDGELWHWATHCDLWQPGPDGAPPPESER